MKLMKIRKIYKPFKCDVCGEIINPARIDPQDLQLMGKVYTVETIEVPEVHMCGYCAVCAMQLLRDKMMERLKEEEDKNENGGND